MIDWVYPPSCGGCHDFGIRWCESCQAKVQEVGTKICPICGDFHNGQGVCQRCSTAPPAFDAVRSWGVFSGPLRNAIHALKYKNDLGLGEVLASYLIKYFNQLNWSIDLVQPVPLSKQRKNERGYNQAEYLARPFSYALNLPFTTRAVKRIRNTRSQVGLSAEQRVENVQNAFVTDNRIVTNKKILLIDDVTTTGATIKSCAEALRKGGAEKVYGLTLARPVLTPRWVDNPSE